MVKGDDLFKMEWTGLNQRADDEDDDDEDDARELPPVCWSRDATVS